MVLFRIASTPASQLKSLGLVNAIANGGPMNIPITTIALSGLTHLEADELAAILKHAGADPATDLVVHPEIGDTDDKLGEPFTLFALMVFGNITLGALAIFLAKERNRSSTKVGLRHKWPDGEELEYTLEVDTSSEEATKADLVKQIAALQIPMPKGLNLGSSNG